MNVRTICILVALSFTLAAFAVGGEKDKSKDDHTAKKVLNTTNEKKDAITWIRYDEGMDLAAKKGKKVFLEFTTKWCGWCKKMHATTFKDSTIIRYLTDDFIAISIDAESHDSLNVGGFLTTERGVARDYGVSSYPTYWILEADGTRIAPIKGYKDKQTLGDMLEFVSLPNYQDLKFQDFLEEKYNKK
ncbi:MAG: thioredoxin fold domain-containing protein [Candidatus Zixiibacteriota bacterium]